MNDDLNFLFSTPTNEGGMKLPVCLVLDQSGSMTETENSGRGNVVKIDELNYNIAKLLNTIRGDANARLISDICIIGCGGREPNVICGYTGVDNIYFQPLVASGKTPLGASVDLALDLLQKRRQYYRNTGIEHYKPIMLIMSDGVPTDDYGQAAARCSQMVISEGLKVLPIGIGANARLSVLKMFSPINPAVTISDMDVFAKLFDLLSRSTSNPADTAVFDWLNDQM